MRATLHSLVSAAALLGCVLSQPALADTFTEANFTGAISPGNANVQPPFSAAGFSGVPGDPITGSFIFDDNLVPSGGTGFVNVPIPSGSGFPISAFDLTITAANSTTLTFDLGNELSAAQGGLDAAVQYNNGAFNGFAYVSDFAFANNSYQFTINGGSISIYQLINGVPGNQQLLSAYINIGNGALTGETPFSPTSPVPLPPAGWLLGADLICLLPLAWRRKFNGVAGIMTA